MKRPCIERRGNERGFSTIELIVAIQLGLFVIGMAYLAYLLAINLAGRWEEKTRAETQMALISTTLTHSMDRVVQVHRAEPDEFQAETRGGNSLHLRIGRYLVLNGQIVGDSSVVVKSGELRYLISTRDSDSEPVEVARVEVPETGGIVAVGFETNLRVGDQDKKVGLTCRFIRKR